MKLTCPACGLTTGADAWQATADARQCLRIVAELPRPVASPALGYLGLFRGDSGRGLSWPRALKLFGELREIAQAPHVQHRGQVARSCTPALVGQALDQIMARPPARLPLKNHAYLMAVIYDMANDADRQGERQVIAEEQSGRRRKRAAGPRVDSEPVQVDFDKIRADIAKGREENRGDKGCQKP